MSFLNDMLATIAPGVAVAREKNKIALKALRKIEMRYDAATAGRRGNSWSPVATDADTAAAQRQRLANVARDMVRNTPFATRAQQVIANNMVGDGIIPKIQGGTDTQKKSLRALFEQLQQTAVLDAGGRNNLSGLQRLVANTLVESGEVLIRRRRRQLADGLPVAMQIEVLEPDLLDVGMWGKRANGNTIKDGIEYNKIGRREAYYLFSEHPGQSGILSRMDSKRVPASEILHIYRQDRPGQQRGVSWFAPVALRLQDLADHQDAQLMRQKIAACFAAFRVTPDGEPEAAVGAASTSGDRFTTLEPGRIEDLAAGEDIRFSDPPGVSGYDEFTRNVLREAAAGLGITYEALTGDLSGVNFSSGRMGRMEMDRNISSWQRTLLMPQMLQPLSMWILQEWQFAQGRPVEGVTIGWVPPARILVDPAREIPPLIKKVRAGFTSRSEVIRSLGHDPERVEEEIIADNLRADNSKLIFDSDARPAPPAPDAQAADKGQDDKKRSDKE